MFSDIPIWSYMYNEQNWIVFTPQLITQQGLNTKTTGIHEYGSPTQKNVSFLIGVDPYPDVNACVIFSKVR